jgi:hypothetical protein
MRKRNNLIYPYQQDFSGEPLARLPPPHSATRETHSCSTKMLQPVISCMRISSTSFALSLHSTLLQTIGCNGRKMRFIHVSLSCLASLMAVQATTLVTVVKTVVHDRVVSSLDISASVSNHEPAKIRRRNKDNWLGDPSVTKVCMTTPVTTCVDITITSTPTDGSKSTDINPTNTDDDGGWEDVTGTPTTTRTTIEPQTITHTIAPQTITHTEEPSNPPLRNTGITTTHAPPQLTFTEIPAEWPPSIGPHGDPDIDVTQLPNIVNPDYTPSATPTRLAQWCDAYPYPACTGYNTPDTDRCCYLR